MGLRKIPWVSSRGWWGYERYHGSLAGGGGAMKDTFLNGLFVISQYHQEEVE